MAARRRGFGKGLVWVAIAVVGLAGLYGLSSVLGSPPDSFRFLNGQYPLISGVAPYLQDGFTGDGIGGEYRIYSWKQDFAQVVASAKSELAAKGYVLSYENSKDATWWQSKPGKGIGVNISPGRSLTRREALVGKRVYDRGWVTVIVGNPASDTIINHVRLGLEPDDY